MLNTGPDLWERRGKELSIRAGRIFRDTDFSWVTKDERKLP